MTAITVKDARWQYVPGEGWLLFIIWERADGKGRTFEEIHAWPT